MINNGNKRKSISKEKKEKIEKIEKIEKPSPGSKRITHFFIKRTSNNNINGDESFKIEEQKNLQETIKDIKIDEKIEEVNEKNSSLPTKEFKAINYGINEKASETTKDEAVISSDNHSSISVNVTRILLASINLPSVLQENIIAICNKFGKFQYLGETYEDIERADYVIMNSNKISPKFSSKTLQAILRHKNLLSTSYFIECETQNQINIDTTTHLIKYEHYNEILNLSSSYDVYIYPTVYNEDLLKKNLLEDALMLLGCRVAETLRLSNLCIVNKYPETEYFPSNIILVNETYLYDSFYARKMQETNKFLYKSIKLSKLLKN